MKKIFLSLTLLFSISLIGQTKGQKIVLNYLNQNLFDEQMEISNSSLLDTLAIIDSNYSEVTIAIFISTDYLGSYLKNIRYTNSLCKSLVHYLQTRLDSGTVCDCIGLGEEQLIWEEDIFLENDLIIPKGTIADPTRIPEDEGLKHEFVRIHANRVKIHALVR